MFYFITMFSSIIAGMGVGGGSIYIMLMTAFNVLSHKEAMAYNLIMFIVVGISATVTNFKNKVFDKKIFFKLIILVIIGSLIGSNFVKNIEEQNLKIYFNIFILIIGIYEIISSVFSFKKQKI